jgi:uncharacterized protein YdaL|tara:strand:- start:7326 stop:7514 length:189 start_codon:yes stop_codon:yes gene_type:complete
LNVIKTDAYKTSQVRKGNVYQYLDADETHWLIEEAIKLGRCDVGLVIASIVKDAYHEENEHG